MLVVQRFLLRAKTPLSNFIHKSLAQPLSRAASPISTDLWPCPLPPPLEHPNSRLGGRCKARWTARHRCRLVTRHIVAACNWLALGRPKVPPADLPPPSKSQTAMLARFEGMAATWLRLGKGPKRGLDRAIQKFDSISEQLGEIQSLCLHLTSQLQPYSHKPVHAQVDVFDSECRPAEPPFAGAKTTASISASQRLDPDRLVFEAAPKFNPEKFLVDPLLKAGFQRPNFFRRPAEGWPPTQKARVQASRENQLRLYKKWDTVQSLYLLPADASEVKFRCGLFSVYKSDTVDRQILNPIPENARSYSLSDATLTLAHASLLTQVYVPADKNLVISSDDLKDFYHAFVVSDSHAARNHIHGVFKGSDFVGCHAYKPELHDVPVVGCFRTLAMGTNFAVETAQHCHSVLLKRAGCLKASEQVRYRHPIPRGPGFDLLCIDDHVFLLLVDAWERTRRPSPNRRDSMLFSQASAAYERVGLRTSSKKAIRNSYQATVLGGQLDGVRGDLAAPRLKSTALAALTFQMVTLGYTSRGLLQCIVGCWIFVLMFRRPVMSILSEVFYEGSGLSESEIFRISARAKQELILLILLCPCITTDLRAVPLAKLFATDASPFAAGACVASVPQSSVLELLRFADHRGHFTRLLPQACTYLGHDNLDSSGPDFAAVPRSLAEGILFDVCEVFRGEGNLSKIARRMGLRVHEGFELQDGADGDIMDPATMLCIIGLICRRVVAYIHLGPPCTTFGTMRRPRLRSKQVPWGFDPNDPATREGNSFAARTAFVLHLAASYGILASAEQPGGSVMYRLDIFARLLSRGFFKLKFSYCSFGTPFQKASCWLVNNGELKPLAGTCSCPLRGRHLRLESSFNAENLEVFKQLCRPSCESVFGRVPEIGESLCRLSGSYPLPAMQRLLELQLPAIQRILKGESGLTRKSHEPPRWVGDLGTCLQWKTLLQYRFKKVNHINVNEELSYRSLLKHLAKTAQGSRFGVLLDSRVTIGCNAKGRSSSTTLNYYLSTSLPYILGGGLYPYLFHVGTHDNCADDPSRLVPLRSAPPSTPFWLRTFLTGNLSYFSAVRLSDDISGPVGRWARLSSVLLLALRDAQAPPGLGSGSFAGQP